MKLFGRTGGHWLFWTGLCYLIGGLLVANSEYKAYTLVVELLWLIALSAPLWCPPFGRYLNMSIDWDKRMFGLFKTRSEHVEDLMKDIKESAYVRPVEPVAKRAECHYSVGTDDEGKIVLRIGGDGYVNTTLTMNAGGTRQLIRMLEAAMPEYEDTGNDAN